MLIPLSEINSRLAADRDAFIAETDRLYHMQVAAIADDIYDHRGERPIILLAGPSGSGKTTTALHIERILDERGCETHTLSLDNYFLPLSSEELQLSAQGKFDLESPGRVDSAFLTEQLTKMIRCEPVQLPKYDFRAAQRTFPGISLTRKPGELVILEGIHALNPDVIRLADDVTVRIYVSVRTRVGVGSETLHPSRVRLLRRIIRDKLFRNRSITETREMFESVERGEERYIMPYKYRALHDVDTFIAYELGVYHDLLLSELNAENMNDPLTAELCGVLRQTRGLSGEMVPRSSLIREFIGNGCFEY